MFGLTRDEEEGKLPPFWAEGSQGGSPASGKVIGKVPPIYIVYTFAILLHDYCGSALRESTRSKRRESPAGGPVAPRKGGRLHDILSLRGFCTRINHRFTPSAWSTLSQYCCTTIAGYPVEKEQEAKDEKVQLEVLWRQEEGGGGKLYPRVTPSLRHRTSS